MDAIIRIIASVIATLAIGIAGVWGGFALSYQGPGNPILKFLSIALWTVFTVAMIIFLWQGRAAVGFISFALTFALMLIWWQRIMPSNSRSWADDVAQMTTGTVEGSKLIIHNVRNFDWRTLQDYTQRWETRNYDLGKLRSVDIIMSYWAGEAIAHMLVSFGFSDGDQVVFSVEIRRESDEQFSEIGGFFKEFELSILAIDERDAVRVRTNVRNEAVYLYRLMLSPTARLALLLAYINEANQLAQTPRFYNTVTVNCTTMVYHMMKRIVGHLPLSYQVLFSGYLPEYVYKVGGFDKRFTLQQLRDGGRIAERAKQSDRSDSFSADIRRGVPGVLPGGEEVSQ